MTALWNEGVQTERSCQIGQMQYMKTRTIRFEADGHINMPEHECNATRG
jgi:hypothetical protein